MSKIQNLFPLAFVLAVFMTACERDGYDAASRQAGANTRTDAALQTRNPDTPTQPAMPAPNAPAGPEARDSAATRPLDSMSKREESTAMPEALHGNNHSSPALDNDRKSSLKRSSAVVPKAKKVIWI